MWSNINGLFILVKEKFGSRTKMGLEIYKQGDKVEGKREGNEGSFS